MITISTKARHWTLSWVKKNPSSP